MRIVCLLPNSLGDFILTTPSLLSLQNHFPNAAIEWIFPDSLTEAAFLWGNLGHPWDTPGTVPGLSQGCPRGVPGVSPKPDITICFPPATRSYLHARKIGGIKRIGYVHEKMLVPRFVSRWCLTDRWICPENSPIHELEAYGKILSLLDVPSTPRLPIPQVPPEAERHVSRWTDGGKKIVTVHLSPRWGKNPVPTLRELARSHPNLRVIALFSEPEAPGANQKIAESGTPLGQSRDCPGTVPGVSPNDIVVPGPMPLSQVAAILKRSHLFVGVDGGLVHVAAALGIPALVFYPEKNFSFHVAKWHPWNVPYKAVTNTGTQIRNLAHLVESVLISRTRA